MDRGGAGEITKATARVAFEFERWDVCCANGIGRSSKQSRYQTSSEPMNGKLGYVEKNGLSAVIVVFAAADAGQ